LTAPVGSRSVGDPRLEVADFIMRAIEPHAKT
jgi:hypothetical protein